MRLKVRRGGISALVVLAFASLLSTSSSFAGHVARDGRTLNLRVLDGSAGAVAAWIVGGSGGELLRAAHAVTAEAGRLEDSPLPGGQVILVNVTVGRAKTIRVLTNAKTAGDVLGALGVRIHRPDVVKPGRTLPLTDRATVRLIRVRHGMRTETAVLPFQTLIHNSKDLAPGQVRILTAGAPGLARLTFVTTLRNGRERSRTLVSEVVLIEPVSQVEEKGPGAPAVRPGTETGDASWYDWYGCGSGFNAAHRSLPFGTQVVVTNLDNGRSVTVTINDRGPYVSGRIIDLCPGAFAAIAPLGQGVARVEISW